MGNKTARLRRARRGRAKIRELEAHRLCVYRTPRHIYAQVISPEGSRVLASASTAQQVVRAQVTGHTGNVTAARIVGKVIAERAVAAGVRTVAFDRAGFRYHGRVRALAEAAREHGLQF